MEKSRNFKFIALAVIAFAIVSIIVFTVLFVNKSPIEYVEKKYSEEYTIILHKTNGPYEGILGEDQKNIYLDIFKDGNYIGGSFIAKDSKDTAHVHQFQQYETFLAVFGYNPDKYMSYALEVSNSKTEPITITKGIKPDKYILDIFVLDTSYDITPNLALVENH